MNDLAIDLELLRSGLRPVTTKARLGAAGPPRLWIWRMRPLYLGAMVLALLAFLGTITVNAFTQRELETAGNETRQERAAPEPSPPLQLVPPPMLSPLVDSDVTEESSEARAPEPTSDAPATSAKATPRKTAGSTRRHRPKPSPNPNRSFIDPWN